MNRPNGASPRAVPIQGWSFGHHLRNNRQLMHILWLARVLIKYNYVPRIRRARLPETKINTGRILVARAVVAHLVILS